MTREEILAMRPGRDLDLLVCERVFDNKTFGSVKPYSTDISAAWPVVEEMLSLGFSFSLQKQIITGREPAWECCFFEGPPASPIRGIKTAPEAICKAASLAKLEDKNA